jgi:tape measure domain-containing protein
MPTAQNLAIKLALDGVQQTVNGINTITAAWQAQGNVLTKNQEKAMRMFTQQLRTFEQLASAAGKMGQSGSSAMGNISDSTTQAVSAVNGLSGAIGNLAGKLSALGGAGAGIGSLIGTIAGGPGGGALGGAIGGLGGNILGAFINIPFSVIGSFGKMFKFVADGFLGIGKSVQNFLFGPMSLMGLMVGNIFKDMFTGVKDFASGVFDAAVAFQQLGISVETLSRRSIALDLNIDTASVSLEQAKEESKGLFDWLKKISLTSPFTMESITNAMKFASAMGLPTKTIKELTIATGNFSAAMGLGEDHQERIMYNLAQIYQQGKLTGREFRDLAISFVPVYDILGVMAKEAGVSTEAFKKLALEGGVPVTDFFKHFIEYMGTNFPDAMKRMSRTMYGVKNNIKDFIQVVLGMEVLGPLMDKISERLADVLDKLLSPKTHAIANDFGQGLARAFDVVAEAVDKLGKSVGALFTTLGFHLPTLLDVERAFVKIYLSIKYAIGLIGTVVQEINMAVQKYIMPVIKTLGGASQESGSWGVNLIKNFAIGMMKGAAKFLATAILYIAAIIKGFFKANSPPKIAPQIDKWGAATINEWINGAVNGANWSALGTGISAQISDSMTNYGQVRPDEGYAVGAKVAGYNRETAKPTAVETIAKVSGATIKFVTEQGMKLAAALMSGFTDGMYNALDEIQAPLKSALDALADLGFFDKQTGLEMFYDFSLDTMKALDEFNKTGQISAHLMDEISRLGMGLGPEIAKLVQKEFDLAKATKDAADAQKRLDDALKSLVTAKTNVTSLVHEYNKLLRAGSNRQMLKAQLQRVNAGEKVLQQAESEQIAAEANKKLADERVDAMKELVSLQSKLVDNMLELLNVQTSAMSGAGDAMSDMEDAIGDLGTTMEDAMESFKPFDWLGTEGELDPGIKAFFDEIAKAFSEQFETTLGDLDVQKGATSFVENFKTAIRDALGMEDIGGGEYISPSQFVPAPSFFQQVIDKIFSGTVNWGAAVGFVTTALVGVITDSLDKLIAKLSDPGDPLHVIVIDGAVKLGISFVLSFWKAIGEQFAGTPPLFLRNIIADWLAGKLSDSGDEEGKKTGEGISLGVSDGLVNPMSNAEVLKGIGEFFDGLWGDITGAFGIVAATSPAVKMISIGEDIVKGIMQGISDFVLSIIGPNGAIATEMNKIINAIKSVFGFSGDKSRSKQQSPLYSIGQSIIQGLIDGFNSMIQPFKNAWNALVDLLPDTLRDKLHMRSPSKLMIEMGQDVVKGFVIGLEDSSSLIEKTMKKVTVAVPKSVAVQRASYAPSATQNARGTISRINNVSFGDVYLQNDMDWAVFKAQVQKAIVEL